ARKPSLDDMGPGTDRPEPLRDPDAVSRIRKPTLDEMGSAANRPIPARDPQVDSRTKAGAYGEQVKGPHKPTLDEMGPHAERGLPVDRGSDPSPPTPQLARGGSREGSDPSPNQAQHFASLPGNAPAAPASGREHWL